MNKSDPLVSVITPTYNSEKYVEETINSVLLQTYKNWEMIIVDDCSTDNTYELVKRLAKSDPRIKLIRLKENSGAAVSRNTAINHSTGKYLAFLDSDDLWVPEKIEKQLNFMINKNIAFSFTKYRLMEEDSTFTDKIINIPQEIGYKELLKNTIIGCLTVMLDKEKLGYIQMPNIRSRQDTAMWLSILKKGYKAYGMQEVLAIYRKGVPGSVSNNKFKASQKTWYMYRKVENLNLLYATWCFVNYAKNALKKV